MALARGRGRSGSLTKETSYDGGAREAQAAGTQLITALAPAGSRPSQESVGPAQGLALTADRQKANPEFRLVANLAGQLGDLLPDVRVLPGALGSPAASFDP